MTPVPQSTSERQLEALREALERASTAAEKSEALARKHSQELQHERGKCATLQSKMEEMGRTMSAITEENKRLRTSLGEAYHEREQLKAQTGARAAQPLRLVQDPTPEGGDGESVSFER